MIAVVNFTVLKVAETEVPTEVVLGEVPKDARCLTLPAPNVVLPAKCLSNQMVEKKFFAVNVLAR